jgi:hypothetical protein
MARVSAMMSDWVVLGWGFIASSLSLQQGPSPRAELIKKKLPVFFR